jgi:tRNA(fMet)-specific endonuclease VapC
MGVILDSSILIAFERRRFDLERFLNDHSPPALAAITAAELLIGVERADTSERRSRRKAFVQNIFARLPIHPFDIAQARLYAVHFADLTKRGELIGDRDLQIAVTALTLNYEIATLNIKEFQRIAPLKLLDLTTYVVS